MTWEPVWVVLSYHLDPLGCFGCCEVFFVGIWALTGSWYAVGEYREIAAGRRNDQFQTFSKDEELVASTTSRKLRPCKISGQPAGQCCVDMRMPSLRVDRRSGRSCLVMVEFFQEMRPAPALAQGYVFWVWPWAHFKQTLQSVQQLKMSVEQDHYLTYFHGHGIEGVFSHALCEPKSERVALCAAVAFSVRQLERGQRGQVWWA